MTTKLQNQIRKLLLSSETGMSVSELVKASGFTDASVRRAVANVMNDVYIADWRIVRGCRPIALYKAVPIPADAPMPPFKPINKQKNKARDTRVRLVLEAARIPTQKVDASKHIKTSTGLTTIRGPWITE